MQQVKSVVIVGGGTSGWLAAAMLARSFAQTGRQISVTLIESANIPTIGVGEGTFPTILNTLHDIGLSEKQFLQHCNASFKQGAEFRNWLYNPRSQPHRYYHPFDPPAMPNGIDLANHWVEAVNRHIEMPDFAHSVTVQAALCDANLAPKRPEHDQYSWLAKYAYHLDAGKLAELVKTFATQQLQVQHCIADITDVQLDEEGFITGLHCQSGELISGDFFVDCSGFSSLLLGQALAVPFTDKSQYLSVDRAVTLQVPHATTSTPIATHTLATAQDAGWIWDIALQNRRGIGYVYCSKHCTAEQAEQTLRDYVAQSHGLASCEVTALRHIPFTTGYRQKSWSKNCVALGFASGFVEPLEATAIAMTEAGIRSLAARFPHSRAAMQAREEQYNAIFCQRWDNIIDFVKLHYCLTQRDDTAFWREQTDPNTIPPSLQQKLNAWRLYGVSEGDFPNKYDIFGIASWQYILYGLRYLPEYVETAPLPESLLQRAFAAVQAQQQHAKSTLLSNRELIARYQQQ